MVEWLLYRYLRLHHRPVRSRHRRYHQWHLGHSNSFQDYKIVPKAQDDAATFITSQGQIRGAHPETAYAHIRSKLPNLTANDQQLVQAILAI